MNRYQLHIGGRTVDPQGDTCHARTSAIAATTAWRDSSTTSTAAWTRRFALRMRQTMRRRRSTRSVAWCSTSFEWTPKQLLMKRRIDKACQLLEETPMSITEVDRKSTRLNSSHLGISYA